MSHDQTLHLVDQLESVLNQFEQELEKLGKIKTQEDIHQIFEAAENLRIVLTEVKKYFIEVRSSLSRTAGIPPAKELAQLVIGASTEALGAIRETLHHLEEVTTTLKKKSKKTRSREELYYADFSSKAAVRKSRNIIKTIVDFADELPDQV